MHGSTLNMKLSGVQLSNEGMELTSSGFRLQYTSELPVAAASRHALSNHSSSSYSPKFRTMPCSRQQSAIELHCHLHLRATLEIMQHVNGFLLGMMEALSLLDRRVIFLMRLMKLLINP
ncbi:hypothetical protein BS78_08G157700 [Paspalum vaginatum]|nr:hypothetical protein BS78_08G157700 [Paspalum vaginatum]